MRVLIVGGGFAGFHGARRLERLLAQGAAGVTLVSPTDYLLYTPLLPGDAAGVVAPAHVTVPYAPTLPRTTTVSGAVLDADLDRHTVSVRLVDGGSSRELPWDRLVLCPGSVTRGLDVPGLAEHGQGLKNVGEALYVHDHVLGQLDPVNNAGMETRTGLLETTEADYDKVLAVNLKSAFFGAQAAARQFLTQGGGGVIVNVSSVHEDWPMPGNTPYCVSKGGMRMLARTAGVELGPHGIRVVNVGSGAVATAINAATLSDPQQVEKLTAAIPLGRVGEPEEIASLVVLLASPEAGYLTATTVFVDGGIMHGSVGL